MQLAHANRYGRRPGRGLRPWLLIPKVLAVGLYVGSLATALLLWIGSGYPAMAGDHPRRLWVIQTVSAVIRYLSVPALLAALIFGTGLLLQHPRQLIRLRWLLVKLISLAILIPSAHLFCSSRLAILRQAASARLEDPHTATQFAVGLALAVIGSGWIVVLGRLKPRLGQNPARAYVPIIVEDQEPT